MPAPIEFFFDFASPYAYFAAHRIDAIAAKHGREVEWRPFMLGAAFKATGMMPLTEQPLRGDYARRDWDRLARRMNLPFVLPERFPIVTWPRPGPSTGWPTATGRSPTRSRSGCFRPISARDGT